MRNKNKNISFATKLYRPPTAQPAKNRHYEGFFSTYLELVRASSLRPLLVQVVAHNLVNLLGGL